MKSHWIRVGLPSVKTAARANAYRQGLLATTGKRRKGRGHATPSENFKKESLGRSLAFRF